jgi:hypothetical protein
MSKEVNQLTVEVEKSKNNPNKLINNLHTIEKRLGSFVVLNDVFTKLLQENNDSLVDFNNYSFDFNEINIKDIFGYYNSTKERVSNIIFFI